MVPDGEETYNSAANPDSVPVVYSSGGRDTASDLPKSVLDYYVNIEKVLEKEEFDHENERILLEEKLLDQIKCDGITKILYHWDCSRVVERLLVNSSSATLLELGSLFLPDVIDLACHNFASHVLELFIMKLVKEIHIKESPEAIELAEQVFRKLCLEVSKLISNVHGSYTLRSSLQVLVGIKVEEDKRKRKRWDIGKDSFYETSNTHPTLKRILHKFTKRLVKEDVGALLWSQQGAPLLSVLLILLHRTNNKSLPNLKSVISDSFEKKVTDYKGFDQFGPLPAVLLDSKSSYVVQSYIKICSKEELEALYDTQYKRVIVPLSLHPVANYTVQTLLEHAPSRIVALDMCQQIVPIFEDLLAESITGVVISVTKCSHHHGLGSSFDIIKELQSAFHVPDDQIHHFFRCLMSLTTHDVLLEKLESYKKPTQSGKPRRDRFEATLAGSLLLQGLFKLGLVGKLEEGLCSLSEDHIVYLCTNPQSSHAIQAFLTSAAISSSVKHRFIKTSVFVLDKLVMTPSGSRIVEAMWAASSNELKSAIGQVLLSKEQAIKDNTYGSIVWKNCNLKAFKLGVNSWEEAERMKKKKVESFEKLIGDKNEKEETLDSIQISNGNEGKVGGDHSEDVKARDIRQAKKSKKQRKG